MIFCFLAVLFFAEAKTAWASASHWSPTDIAAAKARDTDKTGNIAEFGLSNLASGASQAKTDFGLNASESRVPSAFSCRYLALEVRPVSAFQQGSLHFSLANRPPPRYL